MILNDIVAKRIEQLEREKERIPFPQMKQLAEASPMPRGFRAALQKEGISIIAEVKKASPSKGVICENFDPAEIAAAYEKAGADAISVLTEEYYFKGSSAYLSAIRQKTSIPILRKDFIIDEYQIYEARFIGADAVLLIAALLNMDAIKSFSETARKLGLACLTEVHDMRELESALAAGCDIIGINNRNLKTFEVSLNVTKSLAESVPEDIILVSESGIRSYEDMQSVKSYGADAVLIGEAFMRESTAEKIAAQMHILRGGL